jgi:hypothetical protein
LLLYIQISLEDVKSLSVFLVALKTNWWSCQTTRKTEKSGDTAFTVVEYVLIFSFAHWRSCSFITDKLEISYFQCLQPVNKIESRNIYLKSVQQYSFYIAKRHQNLNSNLTPKHFKQNNSECTCVCVWGGGAGGGWMGGGV